jgi:hypothetical protein
MGYQRRRKTFPALHYGDHVVPSRSAYISWPDYDSDLAHIDDCLAYMGKRGDRAYRARLRARAEELVEAHWPEIRSVARALLKQKTMSEDEVRRVMFPVRGRRRAGIMQAKPIPSMRRKISPAIAGEFLKGKSRP